MTLHALDLLSAHACFGGAQRVYQHASREIGLPMRFSVYLPPQALQGAQRPVLVYLAGLTCNEDTFMTKAGAQRLAAELGLVLVAPDTSPRGAKVPSEADAWDFGVGAGFYLDATQAPWATHWRMESYLTRELLPLLGEHLPVDLERVGIFGHSMGGHGALTLALRHPGVFKSVSAFAPIAAPSQCPWGQKAFSGYLGTRAWPTSSCWRTSCCPRCLKPPAPRWVKPSRCAAMLVTTMAITSSRPLWQTTWPTTPNSSRPQPAPVDRSGRTPAASAVACRCRPRCRPGPSGRAEWWPRRCRAKFESAAPWSACRRWR